jgi:hypothetical protein
MIPAPRNRLAAALAATATVLSAAAQAATVLPPEVVAMHQRAIGDGVCNKAFDLLSANYPPVVAPLSATDTVYVLPCDFGVYNPASVVYVVSTGDHAGVHPLMFAQYDQDFGWIGDTVQFNAQFDPTTKTLTARQYYGPGGDCGSEGTWVWRDYAFALAKYRFQVPCDRTHKLADWTVIFAAPPAGSAPRPQVGEIPNFFQTSP